MTKRFIAILAAIMLLPGCSAGLSEPEQEPQQTVKTLGVIWYNEAVYKSAEEDASSYDVLGSIMAGVIPHHGTASKLIASFYQALEDEYDTVVVLGPDHHNAGKGIAYSSCAWETVYGALQPDDELANILSQSLDMAASQADEAVQQDHSVSWHLPYIADHLPSAKVMPVLLSPLATMDQIRALANSLTEYSDDHKILVIASIDFSHYLMPDEAMEHNEVTKRLIAGRDYNRIMKLDSDNIDSPETLYVFLKYCDSIGADVTLLDESISNEQAGIAGSAIDPGDGTTTYLVYGATKEAP